MVCHFFYVTLAYMRNVTTLILLCMLQLGACSNETAEPTSPDAGTGVGADANHGATSSIQSLEELFDGERVIDVEIEMNLDDYHTLRSQGRPLADTVAHCGDSDFNYTYFRGAITVDGTRVEDVGVRKKGYLGSISRIRPSFKIDFDRFVDGQRFLGLERLTLNNDRQDPSHTHQCMSYALFRAAGVPAPRCNWARVALNGEPLGVYSNVESIDKGFLGRHFSDNDGNLYEIQRADFSQQAIEYFEIKTNHYTNDRSDLQAAVAALQAGDDTLLEELKKVFDLDAFLTYWAMEVLVGHWDGATGNSNNHWMYHDPVSDRFFFIPWGTDGTFQKGHVFIELAGLTVPASVYAQGLLPYRLYRHPEGQQRYRERLRELLDELWDESVLLAEVDRIGEMTGADPDALERQRAFIRTRGPAIERELDGPAPVWPLAPEHYPSLRERTCTPPTEISGGFSTSWGDLANVVPDFASAAGNRLEVVLDGAAVPMSTSFSAAGLSRDPAGEVGKPNILVIGVPTDPTAKMLTALLAFNAPELFATGEILFHGFETFGSLVELDDATGTGYRMLGFFGDGRVVLDSAGTETGEPVAGSFEGKLVRIY